MNSLQEFLLGYGQLFHGAFLSFSHSIDFSHNKLVPGFLISGNKIIPNLGARIAAEEMPQVLFWALQGATRLAENNFMLSLRDSHEVALGCYEKWQMLLAWWSVDRGPLW